MAYRISVDTGGTFTDVVVADADGGMTIGKALTTHERIFDGMNEAIGNAAEQLGIGLDRLFAETELLIYGTTRATNAIVTKRVARTAFLATEGFPDVLLLKEGGKFNPHDFSKDFPEPYIPRSHTFEIRERMSSEGTVSIPLDETQARTVLEKIRALGFEAVAVCLIWSIANPAHERRLGELIAEIMPGVPVTLSHQLIPVVREYRRASATAIDASLKPLMQAHLKGLERDLRAAGYQGEILISTTAGGCGHIDAITEKPIYTVGSGPAMAPLAGIVFSRLENLGDNVIICDTGGTTFDVGLVRDGRLTFSRDTWLGPAYTGDLLGIAAVDMRSIGAGGGSIAWIDDGGLMRVGPQSAGSVPGPACYGRGGTEPTVSDAATVLGYFDPHNFLGGRMRLDVDAARRAVATVAEGIGLSVEEAAYRIVSLASDLMMRAVGDITINEGVSPRESTIVAGGGAAGLNIMKIAQELGCQRVVLPKVASALSAAGMQHADIVAEEAASLVTLSTAFDTEGVNAMLADLTARLEAFRAGLKGGGEDCRIECIAEARYLSQVWELDTPLARHRFGGPEDVAALVESFHQVHERVFAVRDPSSPVEVVNWRMRLVVHLSTPPLTAPETVEVAAPPARERRNCYFGGSTPVATGIYRAEHLEPGLRIEGPAIIEEPTTTLVVYPGMSAVVSGAGNYLLHVA
ncbi:hydantoinase/oxoprolinase family protein [Geminicoccus flavidas]|uniref:hydantoinase/oxoprolinase family protein n=1 Tax=Geminicoccus flavidas TaxID=2506407 RepID=UPI001356B733|nr:hydantoinase/oxoprolinase family protein [Geminicoccus flavidas]